MINNNKGWSKTWPKTKGFYWFYGWVDGYKNTVQPKLKPVVVTEGASVLYNAVGQLIWKSIAVGVWKSMEETSLPKNLISMLETKEH